MSYQKIIALLVVAMLTLSCGEAAVGGPQQERHELMEDVGGAAKVIGDMLKGETEYDAAAAMGALETFRNVSGKFGDMFPEGSDSGETEAAPAIWEDRDGFNAALRKWADATAAAIEAAPDTLDAAKPVLGPIFQTCKGCHDNYRIDN